MAEQQNYTCPMHPEIQQQRPGKCPRCGMQLTQSQLPPKPQAK